MCFQHPLLTKHAQKYFRELGGNPLQHCFSRYRSCSFSTVHTIKYKNVTNGFSPLAGLRSTWDAQCFFQSQPLITVGLPMLSNIGNSELGEVKDRLEEFKIERHPMVGFG